MDKNEVDAELRILRLCRERGISVPAVISSDLNFKLCPISLVEFIDGKLLSHFLSKNDQNTEGLLRKLGLELAKVHNIKFENDGLFGENLQFTLSFKNFSNSILSYIESSLTEHAGNKLGKDRLGRLRKCLEENWHLTELAKPTRRLVHSDCNPKNFMVSNDMDRIVLLDWEFAFSGSPIFDFANLFRFKDDFPDEAEDWVIASYKASGGVLPENWQCCAKLFDLLNMCQFLNSEEDRPKTTVTALGIVDQTLAFFES